MDGSMIQEFEHGYLVPLTRKGKSAFAMIEEATRRAAEKLSVPRSSIVVDVVKGRALNALAAVGTVESIAAWPDPEPLPPAA